MPVSAPETPVAVATREADAPEFLRAAIEWLPIGVVVVSGAEGVILMVNREIERVFGYPAGELIGQSVDVLVPDAERTAHASLRRRFGAEPRPRPMGTGRDLFGRRKDGSEVPIEIGLTPIHVGDSLFVLASVVDVTESRRLRAALDERLEFERLIGELGAEFVNLQPEDVDHAVEAALGRIVKALDLDRSSVFQVDEGGEFGHTLQWTRPGWAPPPSRVSAQERFPWHLMKIREDELVCYSSVEEVPNEIDRENLRRIGTMSAVVVPLTVAGQIWGAMTFATARAPRTWTPAIVNRLRVVAVIFANAVARKLGDERARLTLQEMTAARDQLRDENGYLREELKTVTGSTAVVGHSPVIRRLLEQIRQIATTDSTVLLVGETGTGKSLFASRIHELSPRGQRAMVRVNCAAPTAAWVDGELVGSESMMDVRHVGRLELANHSTVLLDEVADLPLESQASLLRVLQDHQIQPHGAGRTVTVDVRVIAATRKDLRRCIEEGTFRDDLFYRLNVVPIHVPPLRERREDIPLLVWRFVDEFSAAYGRPVDAIDQESMSALQEYNWPGNARELRNVVERAMIVPAGRRLRIPIVNGSGSLQEVEPASERRRPTVVRRRRRVSDRLRS
jgi:PAS domain S-box-containing protein